MDKIILIIYVGVKNYPIDKINAYLGNLVQSVMEFNPDIAHYVFPDFESTNFRVECINPKFVTQEEYEIVMKKLENINEELDRILPNAKKKAIELNEMFDEE